MKYAKINKETNQMIGIPTELPIQYSVGDGIVIQGFNKLSNEALYSLGWIPVIEEDNPDPLSFYLSSTPEYNEKTKTFHLGLVPREIEPLIESAKNDIDHAASDACGKYISNGSGQEMRYLEKYNQAIACLASIEKGEVVQNDDYLMISQEAKACEVTMTEKAQEIRDTRAGWLQLASAIEALRMGGKVACAKATSPNEVIQIKNRTILALRGV